MPLTLCSLSVIIFLKSNLYTPIDSLQYFVCACSIFKLSANTHYVYLQEVYGDCVEFLDDGGKFGIENYVEGHNFTVDGSSIPTSNVGEWQTPYTQSTPSPVSSTPTYSRVPLRIPLATLKVVPVDLGSNGKPTNMNYPNLTVHINLHVEEEACITKRLGLSKRRNF